MPVIINDFEIAVEPPQPRGDVTPRPPEPPPIPPSPELIARAVQWDRARRLRVHAT